MIPAPSGQSQRIRACAAGLVAATLFFGVVFPVVTAGCEGPRSHRGKIAKNQSRSTEEIVSVIQANAARLDRALWSSSLTVHAKFKDEKGHHHTYNLEGSLLFRKPKDLRIDLRPGLGDRVMELGSNDQEYWFWVEPEMHLMRWGRHRFAGMPCSEHISVRPDQLASLFGFEGLPGAENGFSGPVRRDSSHFDILLYTQTMNPANPGGAPMSRRYYVDRTAPYLVRMVNVYDGRGQIVVSALFDNFRPAWEGGPLVPHDYSVIWPQEEGRFTMSAVRIEGRTKVSERAFVMPTRAELPRGVRDVIQVDADCK